MPPVIHVAGTNGKGSTVAFMRAMLEAAGRSVHVYTSPHLVRFNERFRLGAPGGGELCQRRGAGRGAGGMRARQRRRADHGVRDRDRGGVPAVLAPSRRRAAARGRARRPARRHQRDRARRSPASITPVSMDHIEFLGDTLEKIAAEKAGILKRGVPAVDRAADRRRAGGDRARRPSACARRCASPASTGPRTASTAGWSIRTTTACSICRRRSSFGRHQFDNAGTAIAALRARRRLALPLAAFEAGIAKAEWPARHAAADARQAHRARARRAASCGSTAATMPTAAARSRRRSAISRSACRGRWC